MPRRYAAGAGRVALVGILTALSMIFLYLAAMIPTGRLGVVALSGVICAGAVVSAGLPAGAFCYAATGILGLLLSPDKGNVVLYLLLFGLYPLVKCLIERLRKLPLEWVCKLAFFNVVLLLCWLVVKEVLLSGLPAILGQLWALFLVGNAVFVVYDLGLSRLIALYVRRIDKALR